jgi:hypothetical protein
MSKKLKVLGLALIVVCAFGAVSASAQAAPQFTVASGSGAINSATTVKSGKLTLTVRGLLWVTCSTLVVNGGSVTSGTDSGSATSLGFSGCSIDNQLGVAQPKCTVKSVGTAPVGTINTNALTATLVNVGGAGYVTFKPPASGTFVEIEVGGCALEGINKVTGTAVGKIESPVPGTLQKTVSIEMSQEISEAAGDKLLYGARESWLDGTVELTLSSGGNWGYDL